MTSPRRPRFVWDTSALIGAWDERYPQDVFPELWERFAEAAAAGEMIAPEEVRVELGKRSTDLLDFLKPYSAFFIPTDIATLGEVASILRRYPKLVAERKRSYAADPFVIATARLTGTTVITEEGRGSMGKPKIPDVCDASRIACVGLLEFFRAAGWRFRGP